MLLLPWADIGYACDDAWWRKYHHELDDFSGLKLSVDKNATRRFPDIKQVGLRKMDRLELMEIGMVGWGGNSGFHCLNLAAQMWPAKILLLGMDMTTANGLHWHGRHVQGLNNPSERNVIRWRRCVDAAAETLDAMGIKVINASMESALVNYPKMGLLEALDA